MYSGTSTQTATRSDERRRNPRLKASSLIYAQLGSDNGGIVVNLGLDGVACHAAQNFIAEKNSTLNVRLRGSGLNTVLVGELVWVGDTQKEVGISFKNLSSDEQKDISDWIAREAQTADTASLPQAPRANAMPAMPNAAVAEERSARHPFSAALAMSRAASSDPASIAAESANESLLQALPNSANEILLPSAAPALDFPAQSLNVASFDPSVSGIPAGARQDQSSFDGAPPTVLSGQPNATVGEEPAQTSVKKSAISKPSERQGTKPISPKQVSQSPASLSVTNSIEKWIPPALLAAWKQLDDRQRTLLGHVGAGCIGAIIALFVVLAVTHFDGSPSHAEETANSQQHTVTQPAPVKLAAVPPSAPNQSPSAQTALPEPSATAPRRPPEPQPSLFASIEASIFGPKPETPPKINDEELRVKVWISKDTGYYYCADDPYTKSAETGEFISQGDALLEGYRSRLGQFCD